MPVSRQAHFSGIFRHSIELAKRGVTITFVGLPKEIDLLKTLNEVQELDFNLVSYKDIEPNEICGYFFFWMLLPSSRNPFQPVFHKLVEDREAGIPGPTCIIGDRFLTWVLDFVNKLNIPYYQFFSCGAIHVRSLQACSKLFADGTLTVKEEAGGKRSLGEFEGQLKTPGLPASQFREMTNNFSVDFYNAIGNTVGDTDGVIVNTFYELEAPQIDAIRQSWIDDSRRKNRQLFLIGPISNAATFKDRSFANLDSWSPTNYMQWLNERLPQSVIYVCLGTIARLNPQQVKELALALEASEHSFLWVISRGVKEALPPNFEERTREKGFIVSGWVSQLQVLAHSSIGGFVTHCGWNSIIESVSMGVPMVAWPQLHSDQFLNCRYVVDVLKIAVEVKPQEPDCSAGEATISTSTSSKQHDEFERALRLLISEEGSVLRSRIQDLKKKVEAAVADGGANKKAMNDLVESIPSWKRDVML